MFHKYYTLNYYSSEISEIKKNISVCGIAYTNDSNHNCDKT